jgi:tetratricopeptide (TPR) repeat protein
MNWKWIAIVAFASRAALAQHQSAQTPQTERPVTLYQGLGTWTHPIATRSPEAQKYFDQGLTLMYGFNRYEALRSFRKALELDASAAMAQWGIAMALGPYLNMDFDPDVHIRESCDALNAGLAIKGIGSNERAWLEAAAARCPDYSQPRNYISAMRALASAAPDDPDVQTLFAESLLLAQRWHWYESGKPSEGVGEAERVLESVLRRHPYHPGANHFYIHAVESSPTPERAVASAQRLMGIVPSAGHMVHMPGHIWLALGDYENVVAVNERAAQVDRDYFARTGVMSSYYMQYIHDLLFILYSRVMQGRLAETRKAIDAIREAAVPMLKTMPAMASALDTYVSNMELRMSMWDEVLAAPQPNAQMAVSVTMWRYARALAFFGKGQLAGAREQQRQFEELRSKLDRNLRWGTANLGDVMDLAAAVLGARLEPDPAAAIGTWKKAVEIQDRVGYFEPPVWYYPVRESLGAALLAARQAPEAETVFREGLRRSPNDGRMLFGLRESLNAQHKTDAVVWVERELKRAWSGADIRLSIHEL